MHMAFICVPVYVWGDLGLRAGVCAGLCLYRCVSLCSIQVYGCTRVYPYFGLLNQEQRRPPGVPSLGLRLCSDTWALRAHHRQPCLEPCPRPLWTPSWMACPCTQTGGRPRAPPVPCGPCSSQCRAALPPSPFWGSRWAGLGELKPPCHLHLGACCVQGTPGGLPATPGL